MSDERGMRKAEQAEQEERCELVCDMRMIMNR